MAKVRGGLSPKTLSAEDATVLAMLAQCPRISRSERGKLVDRLGPEAARIARALGGDPSTRHAEATAVALRDWANGLRARQRLGP